MLRLFQAFYWWLVRLLARLRYRVEVIGLEEAPRSPRADPGDAEPSGLHRPALAAEPYPAARADPADRVRGNVPQGDTVSHDAAGRGPRSPRPGCTEP